MAGIKLTPEEMNLLLGGSGTGETIDSSTSERRAIDPAEVTQENMPNAFQLLDMDDSENVKRQEDSQVFDGSTYKPVDDEDGFWKIFFGTSGMSDESKANYESNQQTYRATGKPIIPGFEDGPRIQETVEDGNVTKTDLVPPQNFGPVERAITGGALNAAKGVAKTAGLAAEALDGRNYWNAAVGALPLSEELKNELEVANPDTVAMIEARFPTMPAASDGERMAQEIIGVVIGGLGGEKVAREAIERLPAAQRAIAETASSFLEKQLKKNGGLDVVNAQKKTELLIKGSVTEFLGANTGATIAMPSDSEGFIYGSHFLDNTAASGLFRVLGVTAKGIGKAIRGGTGGNHVPQMDEKGLAADLFRQIDPDVMDVEKGEYLSRLGILSEVLDKYKEVGIPNGSFGPIARSPQEAMAYGAKEYVERAYGFMRNTLGPKFDEWASQKAAQVADSIQALKRDNLKSSVVQEADARTLAQGSDNLLAAADKFGNEGSITDAALNLAEPTLSRLNRAKEAIAGGKNAVNAANDRLDGMVNVNQFIDRVDKNRGSDQVGNMIANIDERNLKATQAMEENAVSYRNYKDKFDNLPPNKAFNVKGLSELIQSLGDEKNLSDILRQSDGPKNAHFKQISDDPDEAVNILDLQDDLATKDMKWLVTEVRPYYKRLIDEGKVPGNMQDTSQYEKIVKFIDEDVEIKAYPGFKDAIDAFKVHKDKWGQINELKKIDQQARTTIISGDIAKESDETYRQFVDFQKKALTDPDESGVLLSNWMKAYNVDNKEAARYVVSQMVETLGTVDIKTAQNLSDRMAPFMTKIAKTDPDSFKLLNAAIEEVKGAQEGLTGATAGLAKYREAAAELHDEVVNTAAYNFISDQPSIAEFKSKDVTGTFNSIFGDPTKVEKLMQEASKSSKPLVIEGIQSQYLRYMREKFFNSRVVSKTGEGGKAVNEASLNQLVKFLDGSDAGQKTVMKEVFSNQPKFLEDLTVLTEALRDNVSTRSNRPQTFSSNTAVDAARNARSQAGQLLITALFGRLNRTAATVGAFSKAANTLMGSTEQEAFERIVPILLSDTKILTETLDKIVADPNNGNYLKNIVDDLVTNKAKLSNTTKGFFGQATPEKEDDTEKALGVK